jgi:hypothetical protein
MALTARYSYVGLDPSIHRYSRPPDVSAFTLTKRLRRTTNRLDPQGMPRSYRGVRQTPFAPCAAVLLDYYNGTRTHLSLNKHAPISRAVETAGRTWRTTSSIWQDLICGTHKAKRDIIGESLTMNATKVINHYGNFIVTANVDGNYDTGGLPDPLVLAFYFAPPKSDLIVQRNRFDIWE